MTPLFRWYRARPQESDPAAARGMSVKLLHSFYRSTQPSGENNAVLEQFKLLAHYGFNVELIYLSADDFQSSPFSQALIAAGLIAGRPTAKPESHWFTDTDIVHIHNTFPAMSHTWLDNHDLPKVLTAHNYRAFCANGLFLRQGKRCMDCATRGSKRAVIHGCYRNSRVQSIPLAIQQRSSHSLIQLMRKCHRVLLPGEPMQDIFRALGVGNTKVLPNPVIAPASLPPTNPWGKAWLFAGRISPEKGLVDLLHMWPTSETLVVIGDGPDLQEARGITLDRKLSVQFLGSLEGREVQALMSSSRGLIVPSKALEGAPLVYGEAMQSGLPIVAADGSTLATQTLTDNTGAVFTWDDSSSLTRALGFVAEHRAALANRAQAIYADRYTPDVWINDITEVYREAISAHRPK